MGIHQWVIRSLEGWQQVERRRHKKRKAQCVSCLSHGYFSLSRFLFKVC